MTPKEKANELVVEFYGKICNLIPVNDGNERSERFRIIQPIAKKCALISVDEILNAIANTDINKFEFGFHYWKQIKKEIQQL
jgi:hypothetical protein